MAYVVTVTFQVVPGQMDAFVPLIEQNAQASVHNEAGCYQFDVCTDPDRPRDVFLYEIYADRDAFEAHLEAPHFKSFDAATAAMVADKSVTIFEHVNRNPV